MAWAQVDVRKRRHAPELPAALLAGDGRAPGPISTDGAYVVHLRAGPLFGFAAGGGGAVVAIGKRTNQASDMRLHVEASGNKESQIEISAVVGVTILILWPTFVKSE